MADALASGASPSNRVRVQLPSSAPYKITYAIGKNGAPQGALFSTFHDPLAILEEWINQKGVARTIGKINFDQDEDEIDDDEDDEEKEIAEGNEDDER